MELILIQSITIVFIALLGLSVGSFLNVVIYRYQTGTKVGNDRSRCMSCGKTLTPLMLVPLLSFLMQKGRCAFCRTKLSWQYPITEFLGGTIAVATFIRSGLFSSEPTLFAALSFLTAFVFFAVLLVISIYDWKHKIIPDRFSILLSLSALLYVWALVAGGERHLIPTLLCGVAVSLPFAFLSLVSGGRWMGLGDAKLAPALGFFLGYPIGASMPVLAFWLGTIPAIALLLFRPGITMKSEIPFGPFLALSTFILYVYPIDILQLQSIWPNIIG